MKKVKEILLWLPIAHGVFAFVFLVTVPTLRYVYFGTPLYWFEWETARWVTLICYLIVTGYVTAAGALAKWG